MKQFMFILLALQVSVGALAQDKEPKFAVTATTLTGPKGVIEFTMVTHLEPPAVQAKCKAALDVDVENKGAAVIKSQSCVETLPEPLASAANNKAIPNAYVLTWQSTVFFFFKVRGFHTVVYSFDPGAPNSVCERWLAQYRQLDPSAMCIPPRSSR
jgi:hypothetical protein